MKIQYKVQSLYLLIGVRDVFRNKKRYYVGKIPTLADPPSPSMGIFSTKCRFFSEDVQKQKN